MTGKVDLYDGEYGNYESDVTSKYASRPTG
jgi:hypothetical protein